MGIAIGNGVAGVTVVVMLAIIFGISDLIQDNSNNVTPVAQQQDQPVNNQRSVAPLPRHI